MAQIISEETLARFRGPGKCEWCGQPSLAREPHHYFYRKGMGGGSQIDHPFNLIALCRHCHDDAHLGHIDKWDFLAVVAARENKLQRTIVNTLRRIFNADKGSSVGISPARRRQADGQGEHEEGSEGDGVLGDQAGPPSELRIPSPETGQERRF